MPINHRLAFARYDVASGDVTISVSYCPDHAESAVHFKIGERMLWGSVTIPSARVAPDTIKTHFDDRRVQLVAGAVTSAATCAEADRAQWWDVLRRILLA